MKYLVNNKEVSRNTFYFCKKAKEENKTFVLLNADTYVDGYINKHSDYDYYICDDIATYYTKGEAIVTEWYEKDSGWHKAPLEDMTKRYKKSKFKNTMTFTEWYTKNGWKYKVKLSISKESHDIPAVEEFKEEGVRIKLFSVTVDNIDTVKTINKIRNERGNFCVKYVLRNGAYTEIIYEDTYK